MSRDFDDGIDANLGLVEELLVAEQPLVGIEAATDVLGVGHPLFEFERVPFVPVFVQVVYGVDGERHFVDEHPALLFQSVVHAMIISGEPTANKSNHDDERNLDIGGHLFVDGDDDDTNESQQHHG